VVYKGKEYGIDLTDKNDAIKEVLRRTKELEAKVTSIKPRKLLRIVDSRSAGKKKKISA